MPIVGHQLLHLGVGLEDVLGLPGEYGPAEGADPGAGWGKAVDIAVWKETLPSTFCIT